MAQGDQFPGALCSLNGGDSCGCKQVTLGSLAVADQLEGGGIHTNRADGVSFTSRGGPVSDIHHVHVALIVQVGEVVVHQIRDTRPLERSK